MSQYGDGDYCSVWKDRWVTARKEHTCTACAETILPGHRYHVTFYIFDGEPHTTKRCERCETIFEHLSGRMVDDPRSSATSYWRAATSTRSAGASRRLSTSPRSPSGYRVSHCRCRWSRMLHLRCAR